MKHRTLKSTGFVLTLAMLTACGGGGGGGSGSVVPPLPGGQAIPIPIPASITSSLVTSVKTPTYSAASEEAAAFNKLNLERSACGFGLLEQDSKLDTAAMGHAKWNVLNGYFGHYQVANTPGFTGIEPKDRIAASGYGSNFDSVLGDETSAAIGTGTKLGFGPQGVTGLLNAPYHLAGLMSGFKDVGFSVVSSDDMLGSTLRQVTIQINLAYKTNSGAQLLAASSISTYPCEGSVGIERLLNNENPNPVPGRDLRSSPLGSSVYVAVRDGNNLTITNASMTNLSNGIPVSVRPILNSQSDPNKANGGGYFKSHQAVVIADSPMAPNTRYQVVLNGTNNDVAFNRDFIFTTGAAN